jgi:hypothetical protein
MVESDMMTRDDLVDLAAAIHARSEAALRP